MSKEDIVRQLKESCSYQNISIKKSDLSKIHDSFIKIVKDKLDNEGEVRLHGVGTLSIVISREKQCRNPHNGKVMIIPKKTRVKFKASKTFLTILNEKERALVN
ncbi:MAG: HU family DNA-binding protein [Wolbachia endosymbiont of Meromenopon meropis]|nr:HU family DNA-binding protein [Wolbachia endosymbiont of Meromenopon meropis]